MSAEKENPPKETEIIIMRAVQETALRMKKEQAFLNLARVILGTI